MMFGGAVDYKRLQKVVYGLQSLVIYYKRLQKVGHILQSLLIDCIQKTAIHRPYTRKVCSVRFLETTKVVVSAF
jgi:hypothetical protein